MNKPTYRAIDAAKKRLEAMRAEIAAMLEQDEIGQPIPLGVLALQAQDDWEDRSESWQDSETGQEEQEHIDAVEAMLTELEAVRDSLDATIETIEPIENEAPEGAFGS